MADMFIMEFDGVSESDYRNVSAQLGIDPDTGEGDPPSGQLSHLAGMTEDGRLVIAESWESREAQAEFLQNRLGPALAQAGVTATPKVTRAGMILVGPSGAGKTTGL